MVRYRRIDEWLKDTFNSDPGVYEVKSFKICSFFIFFRRILEQIRTIGKKQRLAKEYEMLKKDYSCTVNTSENKLPSDVHVTSENFNLSFFGKDWISILKVLIPKSRQYLKSKSERDKLGTRCWSCFRMNNCKEVSFLCKRNHDVSLFVLGEMICWKERAVV